MVFTGDEEALFLLNIFCSGFFSITVNIRSGGNKDCEKGPPKTQKKHSISHVN